MYHVSAQGVDERMINVHYYYYYVPISVLREQCRRLVMVEGRGGGGWDGDLLEMKPY